MTQTPYTPGPWAVLDGAIYGSETRPVHDGKTCAECGHASTECGPAVVVPIDPGIVPDVKAGHWDDVEPPSAADLRLMAAAPELLEAVRALLNALPSATTHPAIKQARAAIANATGETNDQ